MAELYQAGDRDGLAVVWEEEGIRKLHLRDQSLVLALAAMQAVLAGFKTVGLGAASRAVVEEVSVEGSEAIEEAMAEEEELVIKVVVTVVALVVGDLLLAHLLVLAAVVVGTVVLVATMIVEMATAADVIAVLAAAEIVTTNAIDMAAEGATTGTNQENGIMKVTSTMIDQNDATRTLHPLKQK